MKIESLAKIKGGRQDGAIFNGYLFSFNAVGECSVYEIEKLKGLKGDEAEVFSEFVLDKKDILVPHSNAVMFGSEYYDKEDEFPLLYSNVYNNYAKEADKQKGVCLVYRLQRKDKEFKTTLVQIIEIGFTEDESLWKSAGEKEDVRPYGNFTIDAENGIFYAFTMRDNTNSTRYFAFELPKAEQGELCEEYNAKKVVLNKSDIKEYFDCPYHHYVQGACCHEGKIYSLEGFTGSQENPPAIRVIDTKLKKETVFKKFGDYGINVEPEMIDFKEDICYYTDHHGNMYKLDLAD